MQELKKTKTVNTMCVIKTVISAVNYYYNRTIIIIINVSRSTEKRQLMIPLPQTIATHHKSIEEVEVDIVQVEVAC